MAVFILLRRNKNLFEWLCDLLVLLALTDPVSCAPADFGVLVTWCWKIEKDHVHFTLVQHVAGLPTGSPLTPTPPPPFPSRPTYSSLSPSPLSLLSSDTFTTHLVMSKKSSRHFSPIYSSLVKFRFEAQQRNCLSHGFKISLHIYIISSSWNSSTASLPHNFCHVFLSAFVKLLSLGQLNWYYLNVSFYFKTVSQYTISTNLVCFGSSNLILACQLWFSNPTPACQL